MAGTARDSDALGGHPRSGSAAPPHCGWDCPRLGYAWRASRQRRGPAGRTVADEHRVGVSSACSGARVQIGTVRSRRPALCGRGSECGHGPQGGDGTRACSRVGFSDSPLTCSRGQSRTQTEGPRLRGLACGQICSSSFKFAMTILRISQGACGFLQPCNWLRHLHPCWPCPTLCRASLCWAQACHS